MDKEIEQLLNAELEIQKLLKELQELKKQVGGYDDARLSLEEVRQSLNDLVEKTSVLAEQTHSATTVLGKIGTPEIITHIESTKVAITEFATNSARRVKSVRNLVIAALLLPFFVLLALLAILAKLFMVASY